MSTEDFFRTRLDTMIDLRHPLAVLATRMPWDVIEGALAPVLAHKDRAGRTVEGADLFGPTAVVSGAGVSPAGHAPRSRRHHLHLPRTRHGAVRVPPARSLRVRDARHHHDRRRGVTADA